ncbi:MAG: hypothetical protein ACOYEJ_01730 [Mahellales bacterium]
MIKTFYFILLIIFLLIIVYFVEKQMMSFLKNNNIYGYNFSKNKILTCGGLVILFPLVILFNIIYYLNIIDTHLLLCYLLVIFSIGFVGFIDDMVGKTEYKGMISHLKQFVLCRNFTTGALKALTGVVVGFIVSYWIPEGKSLPSIIVGALTFSLFTNLINMFDTRPGRAVKFFILFSVILIGIAPRHILLITIILAPAIMYLPMDMNGIIMLGDTGSNLLGGILGITSLLILDGAIQVATVILLMALHYIGDRYSFTSIIKGSKILSYIDNFGRKIT